MMEKIKNIVILLIIVIILVGLGYVWGYKSRKVPEPTRIVEIKWMPGEKQTDTLYYPVPVEVGEVDTVKVPVPESTDTAALFAVWEDYYRQRQYTLDFSNDTTGIFRVDAVVGQNRLVSAISTIQPNIRTVYEKETVYAPVPLFSPWVMIGTSADFRTNKIQVGVDIKDRWIVGLSGIRMNSNYNYTIDIGYRF